MKRLIPLLALVGLATTAPARVTEAEAAKLDNELTPMGAIRAGNEAGTIPAWEGGITNAPDGYNPGEHLVDPFPDDKPLFVITADNLDEHKAHLSPGQIAMFETYPDTWRMPVYQSRRSASLPAAIYTNCKWNALNAEVINQGNGLRNAKPGIAFPIPADGTEAIWNHLFRYRGDAVKRRICQAAPQIEGQFVLTVIDEEIIWDYNQEGDNLLARYLQFVRAPAVAAGKNLLVRETLDQVARPRQAFLYNKGLRRVKEAPNVAHDHPGTNSDGLRTSDNLDMFNGSPERYTWELEGRLELYIPYNSYRLESDKLRYKDILQAGHINPEHTRYELHRVWKVESVLRDGNRHDYGRRTFYFDEDSWQATIVDHYDMTDRMWRLGEGHCVNHYQVPLTWDALQCFYDMKVRRYLVFGLDNEEKPIEFGAKLRDSDFTKNGLSRRSK